MTTHDLMTREQRGSQPGLGGLRNCCVVLICAACLLAVDAARAEWRLSLEHTELWAEGQATAVNDLCAGDVDGDGVMEVLSLATTRSSGIEHAELRVVRWVDRVFEVIGKQRWTVDDARTLGRAIACTDIDGDGRLEILTGTVRDPREGPSRTELRIWHWDADTAGLIVDTGHVLDALSLRALAVGDLGADGAAKILIGGSSHNGAELRILNMRRGELVEAQGLHWRVSGAIGTVYGIGVADLDDDGQREVAAASTAAGTIDLRIWSWGGDGLTPEAERQWRVFDQSAVTALAIGRLDADRRPDIAVVGSARDGDAEDPMFGLIGIWQWDGSDLELRREHTWQSRRGNVELFAAAAIDIADHPRQLVVGGAIHEAPAWNLMRVYKWDGWRLEASHSEAWVAPTMAQGFLYALHAADLGADASLELVTAGRAVDAGHRDHHALDIWSVTWSRPSPGLDRLREILGFEGWPFYAALRDALPMPWPPLVYGLMLAVVLGAGLRAVWRLLSRGYGSSG